MSDNNNRDFQVTQWSYPHEKIRTGWGEITWERYLSKEKERWAKHGRDSEIRTENGEMALFANTGKGWMPKDTGEE